jgi:translation initiation factor IF-3
MSINEALKIAGDKNLDLIEVSSNVKPPIVKINDWGKYNYQRIKQLKKNRKNSKDTELKQMRLGLKIGDHDLQIKLNKVLKFIENNHKVKFIIIYKGREQAHKEIGFKLAEKIIEMLGEKIIVDQKPTLAGRQLSFAIRKGN